MTPAHPIGITMGCPVGIGPEIILKFFQQLPPSVEQRPVVLGDLGVLRRCARRFAPDLAPVSWAPGAAPPPAAAVPVLELSQLDPETLHWGEPTAETGRAMGCYIEEAVRLTRQGTLSGITTCPITKTALQMGGYPFPGHTEMLATLCGEKNYAMMMAGTRLRVALVTIHVALAEVPGRVTRGEVLRLIRLTDHTLKQDFGLKEPRVAVAGLNPHAGENGLFGHEEAEIIAPAIVTAVEEGLGVEGPLPPDTVFHRAAVGDFDAVISMYHDQGLIPFKLLHFADGVNVTLGLPLVRTSVDHGTAYDIAGQGRANPASLAAAFALATEIVANRAHPQGA